MVNLLRARFVLWVLGVLVALGAIGHPDGDPRQSAAGAGDADALVAPVYGYRVVNRYPHDHDAYTQGLVYLDGVLYEGTGLRGESTLRKVDLETGEVLQSRSIDSEHFGEGIAVVGDRIYQLTWETETCFVYDRASFELLETFTYQTEGWGLTTDGERLIMSDGTDRLFIRDPETFAEFDVVKVRDGPTPVERLNELEYVDGEVWANVWRTDMIARIDPASGRVTGWIDLTGLLFPEDRQEQGAVLNGIAYDPATGRIFVTGKLWPTIFEIELVPPRWASLLPSASPQHSRPADRDHVGAWTAER